MAIPDAECMCRSYIFEWQYFTNRIKVSFYIKIQQKKYQIQLNKSNFDASKLV